MFFAGDFNGKSHLWWPDGDGTHEGRELEDMFTSLGLSQVISEQTNFDPGKKLSCIDLIVTDQPNIVLDSGTRASLQSRTQHLKLDQKPSNVCLFVPHSPSYQ